MTVRTTRKTITFVSPFWLKGVGETLPPGRYEVETDEEAIEGQGRTAFQRVATMLYVPTGSGTRMCTVDGDELALAVLSDGG